MRWDPVHHTQRVFRKLVTAFSFPGRAVDVSRESDDIEIESAVTKPILALALTLLDGEVGFCCIGPGAADAETQISRLCTVPVAPTSTARYVFVLDGAHAATAIREAHTGTLEAPHLGATIVVQTEFGDPPRTASGPGIDGTTAIDFGRHAAGWLAPRESANREFPLGVDIILVDPTGQLIALPRTTRINQLQEVY